MNKIIKTRCGLPHNKFNFFIDDGTGKIWYDVGEQDYEGYRDYISLEILYGILYFYNKIDWNDILNQNDINAYLIEMYKTLNVDLNNNIDTIIDVGAHHGHYTLNFSRIAKKVISLEPDTNNYNILKTNIELNNIKNVEIHNAFVSNKNGIQTFSKEDFYRFNNDLYQPIKNCKTLCLDNFYSDITDNSIIKIDTEGEEIKVLNGTKKILKDYTPNLWIELHDFCEDNHNDLLNLIDFNKYKILKIGRNKNYPEIYSPSDSFSDINYLFFRNKYYF
jgi:FkbM family methyltransferase